MTKSSLKSNPTRSHTHTIICWIAKD